MNRRYTILKISIGLLISTSVMPLWGQKTLYGKLYKNELGGEGLANVRVKARGANEVLSSSDGSFDLKFTDKKAGDMANLSFQKPNMVLVNPEIEQSIIPANEDYTLEVLMCPAGQRDIYAPKYYHLSMTEAVDARYDKKFEELKRDIDNIDLAEIGRLSNEKDKALKDAEVMAEALAKIDFRETSERNQKALIALKNRDLDKVEELLNDDYLETEEKKLKEQEQNLKTARLDLIQSWLFKARKSLAEFKFEEATKRYEKALDLDSTIYDNQIEYGRILVNYGYHKKAAKRFQRALILAKTDQEKGNAYRFLSLSHYNLGDLQQAAEAGNKALPLLKGVKTAKSQREVSLVHQLLGNIQKDKKDFAAAEASFNLAYAITDPMALIDDLAKVDLVVILNNQGLLYQAQQRYEEALVATKKAVELWRELVAQDSSKYLDDLGVSLNNLGGAYRYVDQLANALPHYEEANAIFKQLYPQNPIDNRAKIAINTINFSMIYVATDDHQRAIALLASGEEAADWLVEHQPSDRNSSILNYIYQNTGAAYGWVNEFDTSLSYYRQALSIRRQLAQKDAQAHQRNVAKTLLDITYLLKAKLEQIPTPENKQMLSAYADSTGKALQICPETPEVTEFKKEQIALQTYAEEVDLDELAKIKQAKEDFHNASDLKAREKLEKTWLKRWEKYHSAFPAIAVPGLVQTYKELATTYLEAGAFEKARELALAGTELDHEYYGSLHLLLALSYAYTDGLSEAEELIDTWGEDPCQGSSWKTILLARLIELENKGYISPSAEQLKTLLN